MPEPTHLLVVLSGVFAFALSAGWLQGSPLTAPMLFTLFGWAIGEGGLGLVPIAFGHVWVHVLAEVTLIVVLFADASRFDPRALGADWTLPARMLFVALPLAVLGGAALAHGLFPGQSWSVAFLTAAILAPTDAALGQSVVQSERVPARWRRAIGVESGLNDGLALPLVIVAALLAARTAGVDAEGVPENVALFALAQVLIGPATGAAVGYLAARLLDLAARARGVDDAWRGIAFLSVAFLCFAAAERLGGNGLLAAFVGGLAFGATLRGARDFVDDFMESEGQLLTAFTFIVFGAVLVPEGLAHANGRTLALALAFLTLVRMLPVWIALAGSGVGTAGRLFLGWFGPRGLASILFALLVLERFALPGAEEIAACVVLTVILSVVLHGISAGPAAAWAGRRGNAGR